MFGAAAGLVLALLVIGAASFFPKQAAQPSVVSSVAQVASQSGQVVGESVPSSAPPSPSVTTSTCAVNCAVFAGSTNTTATGAAASVAVASATQNTQTLPCSSPGTQCGGFEIVSASLSVLGRSSTNLTLSLRNTGNMLVGYFEVYLNTSGPINVNVTPEHVKTVIQNPGSQLFYNGTMPIGSSKTISFILSESGYRIVQGQEYQVGVVGYVLSASGGTPETDVLDFTNVMATSSSVTEQAATAASASPTPQQAPGSALRVLPSESASDVVSALAPLGVGLVLAGLVYGLYVRRQDRAS